MVANFGLIRAWGLYSGDDHSLMGTFSDKRNALSLVTKIGNKIKVELKNPDIDAALKSQLEEFQKELGELSNKVNALDNADKKGSEKRQEIKELVKKVFGVGLESSAERAVGIVDLEKQLEAANKNIADLAKAANKDARGMFAKDDAIVINAEAAEIARLQNELDSALIASGQSPRYQRVPVAEPVRQTAPVSQADTTVADKGEKEAEVVVQPKTKAGVVAPQPEQVSGIHPPLSNQEIARRLAAVAETETDIREVLRSPVGSNRVLSGPVLKMSEEDKKRIDEIDKRIKEIDRLLSTQGKGKGLPVLEKNALLAERANLEKEKIEIKTRRLKTVGVVADNTKDETIDVNDKNKIIRGKDKYVHEKEPDVVKSLEKRIQALEEIVEGLKLDRSGMKTEEELLKLIKDAIIKHEVPDDIKRILEELFRTRDDAEKDSLKKEIGGLRADLNMVLSMAMSGGMYGHGFSHFGAQGMFPYMNMGAGYGFMQGGMMGPMMIYGMMPVMPPMIVMPVMVAQPAMFMGGFQAMMGGNMFGVGTVPPQVAYQGGGYQTYQGGGYGASYGQANYGQTQTVQTEFEITAQISRVTLELQLMEQKKKMNLAGPEIDGQIEQAKKLLEQLSAEATKLKQQGPATTDASGVDAGKSKHTIDEYMEALRVHVADLQKGEKGLKHIDEIMTECVKYLSSPTVDKTKEAEIRKLINEVQRATFPNAEKEKRTSKEQPKGPAKGN